MPKKQPKKLQPTISLYATEDARAALASVDNKSAWVMRLVVDAESEIRMAMQDVAEMRDPVLAHAACSLLGRTDWTQEPDAMRLRVFAGALSILGDDIAETVRDGINANTLDDRMVHACYILSRATRLGHDGARRFVAELNKKEGDKA